MRRVSPPGVNVACTRERLLPRVRGTALPFLWVGVGLAAARWSRWRLKYCCTQILVVTCALGHGELCGNLLGSAAECSRACAVRVSPVASFRPEGAKGTRGTSTYIYIYVY